MAEKNGFASILDTIVGGLGKMRDNAAQGGDTGAVANVLPKPDEQVIGNGIIVWRWKTEFALVESVLVTNTSNQLNMPKDKYFVNMQMPLHEQCAYTMFDDTPKELGQAILSAWNWQHIWKLHAGDFLLETLSKEAPKEAIEPTEILPAPEYFGPSTPPPVPATCDDDDYEYDVSRVQG